jgi:hypothetical protein
MDKSQENGEVASNLAFAPAFAQVKVTKPDGSYEIVEIPISDIIVEGE